MRGYYRHDEEVERVKLQPDRAERYPFDASGQPELYIDGSNKDGWEVWVNTGTAEYDGLCIGVGDTRQEAVAEAVRVVEWLERTMQGLPQETVREGR